MLVPKKDTERRTIAEINDKIASGKVFQIAVEPELEVWPANAHRFAPVTRKLPARAKWTFPPASVSAVELKVAKSPGG